VDLPTFKGVKFLLTALALVPAAAHGYSLATPSGHGCHEVITADALRAIRAEQPDAMPPVPGTSDEQALVADVPFVLDPDLNDFASASLLLAIRDNDLKGRNPSDSFDVVPINGDPSLQMEHCLRAPVDDEPSGSANAVAACRAFVEMRFSQALDGLGPDGNVDASRRMNLPVYLNIRGAGTDAQLPIFYVRMGQALHAVQDGFSHNLRSSDGTRITTVLNWVDYANKVLLEPRDGPPHMTALDDCNATDPDRLQRRQLVDDATLQILRATVEPGADPAAKLARLDQILDQYFTVQAGCTLDNGYCGSSGEEIRDKGCAMGGRPGGSPWLLLAPLTLLMMRRRTRLALAFAVGLGVGLGLVPSRMVAADEKPVEQQIERIQSIKKLGSRFGFYAAVSGAVDRPALAGILALRVRLTPRWLVGFDTELNPWISNGDDQFHLGTFNAYFTGIVRYPLKWSRVNLHQSVNVGASVLLFDVYGAPAGSVGLYLGTTLLGIDIDLGHYVRLVIDPLNLSMPIPHLTAAPFWYLQYRLTVGFQFGS
jgi:hypothetical protein